MTAATAATDAPNWIGKQPTLQGERHALAVHAAQVIATYGSRVTLRQVYYRLVAANLIPNTDPSYKRLGGILTDARKVGLIGWDAMEDRGRSIESVYTYSGPDDARAMMRAIYDEDRWTTQPQRVAVIIEKAALAGVVEPVCRRWQVPFIAARGYASATLLADASVTLRGHHVVYLGDHDPSGTDMTRDWEDRLAGFAAGCTVERIALTMEQVNGHNLPPQPVKTTDARHATYAAVHGSGVWELDALPPNELERLVEDAITARIDMTAWNLRDAEVEANRNTL